MHLRNFLISTLFAIAMIGCSGSSNSTVIISVDPSGEWRVEFVNLIDDCELLASDTDRFTDDHTIVLTGENIALTSLELPLGEYEGSMRAENSFTAQSELIGDLFGLGFSCTLSEAIAYNDLTETEGNVVYEVKIVCDDGSRCDTAARGLATRS